MADLTYTGNILAKDQLVKAIRQAWTELPEVADGLMLLNGVWGNMPGLREEILKRALNCHVVVADEPRSERGQFGNRVPRPLHMIEIFTERMLASE